MIFLARACPWFAVGLRLNVGMSRRPALATPADIARAMRAAKQVGGFDVEVRGASILIRPTTPSAAGDKPVAEPGEIAPAERLAAALSVNPTGAPAR